MKAILLALTLSSLANAYECTQYEAQMSGRISRVKWWQESSISICKIYINFDLSKGDTYNSNKICPLLIEEAMTSPIIIKGCNPLHYSVDQLISGVLVKFPNQNFMSLE